MSHPFTPTTMHKGGKVQVADTRDDYQTLLWEGWTPDEPAPLPPAFSARQQAELEERESALSGTYAKAKGSNLARSIRMMQAGRSPVWGIVGDSIADPTTAGNAGGGPFEKLAAILEDRFGVDIIIHNYAESGFTAARATINGNVKNALSHKPDMLGICLGKNDIGGDINGQYAPGYPREASMAAVERMIVAGRRVKDTMDVLIVGEGPYVPGSSSNDDLVAWEADAAALAAAHGAEFADVYAAFLALGDWSSLMYDSTHQNPQGNDLYAEVLAEHFPADYAGPVRAASTPPAKGAYGVDRVDLGIGSTGMALIATPGTTAGGEVTYTTGGTGWVGEVTSTPGDYVEVSGRHVEQLIQVSTAAADATVVDLVRDGVTIETDLPLHLQGKQGQYWVPFSLNMDGTVNHSTRLVLKSGTLRTYAVAGLAGPAAAAAFTPETRVVDLGSSAAVAGVDSTGAYTNLLTATPSLPSGWAGMRVEFIGHVSIRTTAATAEPRHVHVGILYTPGGMDHYTILPTDTAADKFSQTNRFTHVVENVSTSAAATLRVRVLSTAKTNVGTVGFALKARLTRTA